MAICKLASRTCFALGAPIFAFEDSMNQEDTAPKQFSNLFFKNELLSRFSLLSADVNEFHFRKLEISKMVTVL